MSANNTWISNIGFIKRYQIETRLISLIMKAFYVIFHQIRIQDEIS